MFVCVCVKNRSSNYLHRRLFNSIKEKPEESAGKRKTNRREDRSNTPTYITAARQDRALRHRRGGMASLYTSYASITPATIRCSSLNAQMKTKANSNGK